jgi:hypothetical protein
MGKKVRFLQTSAGDYGLAQTGDELVVTNSVASKLEENKVVEVLGDAGDEPVSKPTSGGVRFIDETNQSAAPAGETDEKNPTGKDKPVAKAAPPKAASKTAAKKGKK